MVNRRGWETQTAADSGSRIASCRIASEVSPDHRRTVSKEAAEYAEFVKWKAVKETKEKEKTVVVYRPAAVRTVRKSSNEAVAPAPTKKGWSKAAKGAAIGAGAGAVAGAIINKRNRAVGAVIGGVVGGGVGYGIGRAKDKKDGRY